MDRIIPKFPKYIVESNSYGEHTLFTASTLIRKKYRGKWYLTAVIVDESDKDKAVARLIYEAYWALQFLKINKYLLSLVHMGIPSYNLDDFQGTEEERHKHESPYRNNH